MKKLKKDYERCAGILLHPTSLPSKFGIGDLGKEAFEFIDYLKSEGQTIWQVLPLNPVDFDYSPYKSPSAFAGNPMIISPEVLVTDGLLTEDDIKLPEKPFRENKIEFKRAWEFKTSLLKKAFQNFKAKLSSDENLKADFENFCQKESYWIEDYAMFATIKDKINAAYWVEWEDKIKKRDAATLKKLRQDLADDILYVEFEQYIFSLQWQKVHKYANENGIKIFGDMPIFVSEDSTDVWANPELFQLKDNGLPEKISGSPPDEFSEVGQIWGNPQYNWDIMKAQDYKWWKLRFKKIFDFVDIVRVDHFRGFEAYWEIDGNSKSALIGKWIKGPGKDFFDAIKNEIGEEKQLVAEDLGTITYEVRNLRKECGFLGMNILQFKIQKFIEIDQLEYVAPKDTISYTGTHDNNTVVGWFTEELNDEMKIKVAGFLNAEPNSPEDVCTKVIEAAYASESYWAIVAMQDVLKLGGSFRMAKPGTVGNNKWGWQLTADYLSKVEHGQLKALCNKYSR